MGRPVVLTKTLAAASADAICLSQSGIGGTPLDIDGASGGVLDTQRRVLITSDGDDTGITFTVIGTDDDGAPRKSLIAGGNQVAVATPIDFRTVTSVVPSGDTASTVTVGTNTTGSTPWVLFDTHLTPPVLSLALVLPAGGGTTASAEYTYDPVLLPIPSTGVSPAVRYAPPSPNPLAWGVTDLDNITDNADTVLRDPIMAWRLTVSAGTGTAELTGIQAGIAGA